LLLFRRALYGTKDVSYFALKGGELKVDYAATRVKDYVDRGIESGQVVADGLAHAPLDAVAIDGLAHHFADGEANAGAGDIDIPQGRAVWSKLRTKGEEVRHLFCELLAAGFVDALVVGVFAKTKDDGSSSHTAGLDLSWSSIERVKGVCSEPVCIVVVVSMRAIQVSSDAEVL
jgi:hypothetical protein